MELKRVVVTGLGAVTPLGNDPTSYWDNLIQGVSGAAPITRFDTTNFKTKFACEVKNFDVQEYIHRKDARKMDLFTQYAVVSSMQAIQDAGIVAEGIEVEDESGLTLIDPDRAGVIWGSGVGGFKVLWMRQNTSILVMEHHVFRPSLYQ